MERRCVYCNSPDLLNTTLTIPLDDGEKATVYICDTHAEDAAVKTAKQKYLERKAQIDEFLAKARELGLNIQIEAPAKPGGIATATTQQVAPVSRQVAPAPVMVEPGTGGVILDSKTFDARTQREVVGTSGALEGFGPIERNRNINLTEVRQTNKIPEAALDGQVVVQPIEAREGQVIMVPTQRSDGLGTTTIQIRKTTDGDLQRRTRQMAMDTVHDRHPGYGQGGGYDADRSRVCPICRGSTVIKSGGQTIKCTKCKGSGEITV